MLDIRPHLDGSLLKVRARPGSRRNEIRGVVEGRLCVAVTSAPEKGKANKAIIALLASETRIKKSQLAILSGASSRDKLFLVAGWTPVELRRAFAENIS